MVGLEAGQPAFGDIYAWFSNLLMWPVKEIIANFDWLDDATTERMLEETADRIIAKLSEEAAKIQPEASSMVALDWLNGRRTPDANQGRKNRAGLCTRINNDCFLFSNRGCSSCYSRPSINKWSETSYRSIFFIIWTFSIYLKLSL